MNERWRAQFREKAGSRGTQKRNEGRVGVEAPLMRGPNNAGENLLRLGAAVGAVAAAEFSGHDRGAQRLLGTPVRGVDRRIEEKRPNRRKLAVEMARKPLDVGDAAGPIQPLIQAGDQVPARDGQSVCRDRAGAMTVAQRERLLENCLDLSNKRDARMIGAQGPTAAEQMRQTRLMSGLGKLTIRRPPIADDHAGIVRAQKRGGLVEAASTAGPASTATTRAARLSRVMARAIRSTA